MDVSLLENLAGALTSDLLPGTEQWCKTPIIAQEHSSPIPNIAPKVQPAQDLLSEHSFTIWLPLNAF